MEEKVSPQIIHRSMVSCLNSTLFGSITDTLKRVTSTQQVSLGECIVAVAEEDKVEITTAGVDALYYSIHLPNVVKSIACGRSHCIVSTGRKCYSMGKGPSGELGLGPDLLEVNELTEIAFPPPSHDQQAGGFRGVAANAHHSLIITEPYGEVFTFGCGAYYRLGHDSDSDQFYPQLVQNLCGVGRLLPNGRSSGIRLAGCGLWHCVVVADGTGDVLGWGWNRWGQLGPLPTSSDGATVMKEEIIAMPRRLRLLENDDLFVDEDVEKVDEIHCGDTFTALQTSQGRLLIMGCLHDSSQGSCDESDFCLPSEGSKNSQQHEPRWLVSKPFSALSGKKRRGESRSEKCSETMEGSWVSACTSALAFIVPS
eukprot:gene2983-3252_t